MVDSTIIEMINRDIDGELTDIERSRLSGYLKNNAEAHALYVDLKQLAANLNAQPQVDPPSDLKAGILSKLNPELYRKQTRKKPVILRPAVFFNRQRVRTMLAYAAVMIIGFCLSILLLNPQINPGNTELYKILGTMGIKEIPQAEQLASVPINMDQLRGEAVLKHAGSYLWIEFNLDSGEGYEARINYDAENLTFMLFKPTNPTELSLKHSENTITINTNQPFALSFIRNSNQASNLAFSIFTHGEKSADFNFSVPNILNE